MKGTAIRVIVNRERELKQLKAKKPKS